MERPVDTAMEARDRRLPDWFARIRTGQILLPVFQRFEAWGAPEVVSLLEAVLRGLPAGATLVLQIGAHEPFESRPISGAPTPTAKAVESGPVRRSAVDMTEAAGTFFSAPSTHSASRAAAFAEDFQSAEGWEDEAEE